LWGRLHLLDVISQRRPRDSAIRLISIRRTEINGARTQIERALTVHATKYTISMCLLQFTKTNSPFTSQHNRGPVKVYEMLPNLPQCACKCFSPWDAMLVTVELNARYLRVSDQFYNRAVQWHYIDKLSNDTVPNSTFITTNHRALFIYNRTKITGRFRWFRTFSTVPLNSPIVIVIIILLPDQNVSTSVHQYVVVLLKSLFFFLRRWPVNVKLYNESLYDNLFIFAIVSFSGLSRLIDWLMARQPMIGHTHFR